ncbi:MAG: HK97 family phage prohead protease [Pseudomonadota bacterium]
MLRKQTKLETRDSVGGREVRNFKFEIKDISDTGVIEGYGSVFDTRDSYDDVIKRGAYAATLAAHKAAGSMPAMLWQHDSNQPIGVWLEMEEDEKGLRVRGQLLLSTVRGREAYELLKMRAMNGLSIGFMAKSWSYEKELRILTEIDLWELSVVTFPANTKATITGVKSGEPLTTRTAEQTLRDAGFSRAGAKEFIHRVMKLGEERRDAAQSTAKALAGTERLLKSLQTAKDAQ